MPIKQITCLYLFVFEKKKTLMNSVKHDYLLTAIYNTYITKSKRNNFS